jgi:hypothetical protein
MLQAANPDMSMREIVQLVQVATAAQERQAVPWAGGDTAGEGSAGEDAAGEDEDDAPPRVPDRGEG